MTDDHKYYKRIYSGTCLCGCKWDEHHLGAVLNKDYYEATGESWVPQECERYGFNETGGEGPNGEQHCHNYCDKDEPRKGLVREWYKINGLKKLSKQLDNGEVEDD